MLPENIMFTAELEHKDGVFVVSIQEIDLFGWGNSFDEAMNDLANDLIEYAHDYMICFDRYSKTPNRKHHLPYVKRVLMCGSKEEVKELIKLIH